LGVWRGVNKRLGGLSRRKGEGIVIPPPFMEVSFSSLDQKIWRVWRVLI